MTGLPRLFRKARLTLQSLSLRRQRGNPSGRGGWAQRAIAVRLAAVALLAPLGMLGFPFRLLELPLLLLLFLAPVEVSVHGPRLTVWHNEGSARETWRYSSGAIQATIGAVPAPFQPAFRSGAFLKSTSLHLHMDQARTPLAKEMTQGLLQQP